tara:strand:+ start:195 stop:1637 length:1443 start_codon:yes stop_codon:yes gene_type:complete
MRYLYLVLILLVLQSSYSQTKEEIQLCLAVQSNNFSSNSEANVALERILNVIGAARNFILTPCNQIDNALATSYKGTRYILYDKEFMSLINSRTNDWSSLFILAHEVGHHINGHSLDLILYAGGVIEPSSLVESRRQELEADEFAGFILSKLGASLAETQEAIKLISSDEDDSNSTHPSRNKRLSAIELGFNKAKDIFETPKEYTVDKNSYENILLSGLNANDRYTAISFFNKAVEIRPYEGFTYYSIALEYFKLKDYENAMRALDKIFYIDDYGEAFLKPDINFTIQQMELSKNGVPAYVVFMRAQIKENLEDFNGAIKDLITAGLIYIEDLREIDSYSLILRNMAKIKFFELNDSEGAFKDIDMSVLAEEDKKHDARYNRGMFHINNEDYKLAIPDLEIAAAILEEELNSGTRPRNELATKQFEHNYYYLAYSYLKVWANEDELQPMYLKKFCENYENMYFNGGRNDFLSKYYLKYCD